MPAVHAPEAAIQKNAVNSKLKKWAVARDFITCGSLFLESTHTDLLTGRALCGNIELAPYEALVLKKIK